MNVLFMKRLNREVFPVTREQNVSRHQVWHLRPVSCSRHPLTDSILAAQDDFELGTDCGHESGDEEDEQTCGSDDEDGRDGDQLISCRCIDA